ncbi:MAG TPA: PH domain-containing protein [Patescibacteria group bacterium]|jgi:uncharacterized membrane protein YdbT with pleckstrin-like domain
MPEVFNAPKSKDKNKFNGHRHVDEYSEIMSQEKPTRNYFKAFLPKPQKTAFDTQTGEENIILLLRQHPVTLFKQVVMVIIAVILPLLSSGSFFTDFLPASYILGLNLGWYLLVFSYTLATFLTWFYSVYIISDERIIDVDFVSLLFKDVSSAKIDAIQDISSKTSGFLASIINYGTVYIQTAGEQREIQFENIPQPAKVAAILNELMLEEEREKIEGRVQ